MRFDYDPNKKRKEYPRARPVFCRSKDYGERRFQALVDGFDGKPYVVVFARRGMTMWIISFRRAHLRERKSYGAKT